MTERPSPTSIHQSLLACFDTQKQAFHHEPDRELARRIEDLRKLKQALLAHSDRLCDALERDYQGRSRQDSLLSDILPCVMNLRYSSKHLKQWFKPEKRRAGLLLAPARVEVHYQPLGVVGIVVPWNFPVMLSIGPLIAALAAGNRAMIKLSEFTPHTNRALIAMLAEAFDKDQVACIEGEADVAAQFTALPFDHLLFTGSTAVGHHVMRAAAENLTPVTLELGGKSPVIVGPDMDLDVAVKRMAFGKCLNAGQICVAPDYVLVPREKLDAFVDAYRRRFETLYPDGVDSPDYGSVINDRHYQRLTALLEDALAKGARAVPCARGKHRDDRRRRITTHLLLDTDDDMRVRQDEIFGPLLPLVPYDNIKEALDHVRDRPRPLALYLLSYDRELQQQVIDHTHAGGMCINDTLFHVAAEDAPFGGVGPSGMGHYHGQEGFKTFSNAKTVLRQGRFYSAAMMQPPYGKWLQKLVFKLFLR
ncbi:coniferyl aldehyde dehydrogenase [Ferrimonas sediminicola]|uniref:Aldehyde dehydrogenase n=1 Tax=Ferrimonas sediminicola TaxID=2569538 RepID=A0A4U1BCF6_9GAMM|nr:coniferyl aldehyde dehydrogenase [Ferrimonas sediminicola]TKB48667.1 coniferyl aldehyde dehydrogenase [Ferrimonas sediminicola]